MIMAPRWRKFTLATHVATSVGLLGGVASFLLLAVVGVTSSDIGLVRATYPAMALIAWVIILPLALLALVIGLIESLGTKWGLIRHYWVIVKLVLTVIAIAVLLLQMGTVSYLGHVAASIQPGDLVEPRTVMVVHSAGGLLVLLLPLALSIYKPRGRTGWGRATTLRSRRQPPPPARHQ
jgi:hypothetical protein